MPVMLMFAIYQCSCGEIFKRKSMFERHVSWRRHTLKKEYTLIVNIDRGRNDALHYQLIEGKAVNGFK